MCWRLPWWGTACCWAGWTAAPGPAPPSAAGIPGHPGLASVATPDGQGRKCVQHTSYSQGKGFRSPPGHWTCPSSLSSDLKVCGGGGGKGQAVLLQTSITDYLNSFGRKGPVNIDTGPHWLTIFKLSVKNTSSRTCDVMGSFCEASMKTKRICRPPPTKINSLVLPLLAHCSKPLSPLSGYYKAWVHTSFFSTASFLKFFLKRREHLQQHVCYCFELTICWL